MRGTEALLALLVVASAHHQVAAAVATAAAEPAPPGRIAIRTARLSLVSSRGPGADPRFAFASRTRKTDGDRRIRPPVRGTPLDPTRYGAELRVYGAGFTTDLATYALPADGWRALGSASRAKGYRFRGPGAVHSVVLAPDVIRIRGRIAYSLDEPAQGVVAVELVPGTVDDGGWCAAAPAKAQGRPPSTARDDRPRRFVGAPNAAPPDPCPPLPSHALTTTTSIMSSTTTSSTIPPLWAAIHATVIAPRCGTCHGVQGEGGLNGLTACKSGYASLVNVPSTELPGRDRVEPGAPGLSWLVQKLEGTQDTFAGQCVGGSCGDPMPLDPPPLEHAARDAIIAWIGNGAANDCP